MVNRADTIRQQLEHISFADAEILAVTLEAEEAHILIRDWRERKIHLRCQGVALFKSFGFGGGMLHCEISSESKELDEAREVMEQNHDSAADAPGLVQITFIDEAPVLAVVFTSLGVDVEN